MSSATIATHIISRIIDLPDTITFFTLKAIVSIKHQNQPYWYMSCSKCKRFTTAEYKEEFDCLQCKNNNCHGLPRYITNL
ncbi:hypothetical protein Scep_020082 [Stephania cephalantha]|uniref:Uncharacterized protein n=1 Tax=Stephania cephalantha TaxID=152367 RepID=A0AAP0ICF9_9MAGN